MIVLGQDSLADGTPVYVLSEGNPPTPMPDTEGASAATRTGGPSSGGRGGTAPTGFDPKNMPPQMLEMMKARMKERGLSDEQIEERIEKIEGGEITPPGRGPRP